MEKQLRRKRHKGLFLDVDDDRMDNIFQASLCWNSKFRALLYTENIIQHVHFRTETNHYCLLGIFRLWVDMLLLDFYLSLHIYTYIYMY